MPDEFSPIQTGSVAQRTSTDGRASALASRVCEMEYALTNVKSTDRNVDSWEYELVFVNSDSGHRRIGTIEVNVAHKVVYLYEITNG